MALVGSPEFFEAKLRELVGVKLQLDKMGVNDPKQLEYHCARLFLYGLFDEAWYRNHIEMHSKPDSWMLNGSDDWLKGFTDPIERRIAHYDRVIRLADALFTVVSQSPEDEDSIKYRFKNKKSIKDSFVELQIASLLVVHGFSVHVKKETRSRGNDFDLEIAKDGEKISVEVTGKDEQALTASTLVNTFNGKRD